MQSSLEFSVLFSFGLVCLQLLACQANISNLRKCADEQCKAKISTGRTTQRYSSRENGVLSFRVDDEVDIYSKEAGTNKNLWGVEIKGKIGYVPMKFIKEEKVFYKDDNLKHIVPTIPIAKREKNKPTETKISESQSEHSTTGSNVQKVFLSPSDAEYEALKDFSGKNSDNEEVAASDSNIKINLQEDSRISDSGEIKLDIVDTIKQEANQNKGINVKLKDSTNNKVNVLQSLTENSIVGSSHIIDSSSINIDLSDDKIQHKLSDGSKSNENLVNDSIKDEELGTMNGFDIVSEEAINDNLITPKEASIDGSKITDNKVRVVDIIIPKVEEPLTSGSKLESKITDEVSRENTEGQHEVSMENTEVSPNTLSEGQTNTKLVDHVSSEFNHNELLTIETKDPSENNLVDVPITSDEVVAKPASKVENEVNNDNVLEESDHVLDDIDDEEMDNDSEEMDNDSEEIDDEELDNEDEGNGNEGEENGNEIDINSSTDLSSSNSELNVPPSVEEIMPSKPLEQMGIYSDSVINNDMPSDSKSKHDNLPHPTPSPVFEVFDGTTFYMNEGENSGETVAPESSTVSQSLQASQVMDDKLNFQTTPLYSSEKMLTLTTETPQFPNTKESIPLIRHDESMNLLTEDVIDINKQSFPSVSEDVNSELIEDSSVSVTPLVPNQSEDFAAKVDLSLEQGNLGADSNLNEEFATPKPETVVDVTERSSSIQNENEGNFISSFFFGTSEVESDKSKNIETLTNQSPTEDIKILNDNLQTDDPKTLDAVTPLEDNLSVDSVPTAVLFQESDEESTESPNIDTVLQKVEKDSLNDLLFIDPYNDKNIVEEFIEESSSLPTTEDVDISISDMDSLSTNLMKASRNLIPENMALAIEEEFAHPHISFRTAVVLIVVGFTIVTLYIAHIVNVKYSREAPILDAMNKLDKQHRFIIEENNNLKRKLSISSNGQIKCSGMNLSDPMEITLLKNELASTKFHLENELEQLKLQNQQLESDLETSTASEEELHRMISELLSNQKETENFEDSVNSLQTMLDDQMKNVESLKLDLSHKTRLNDELRSELKTIKTRSAKLEYQIEQLTQSLDEIKSLRQDALKRLEEEENNVLSLREINNSMRQEADVIRKQSEEQRVYSHSLEETVKDMKKQLNLTKAECQVSKECLKNLQLQCGDGSNNYMNKLSEIFNIIEVKSKLEVCEKGRLEAETKLKEKEESHEMLRKQVENLEMQSADTQTLIHKIEMELEEAKLKLSFRTQYYEEREAQLKKELESQEERMQDAEGSAADISSSVLNYKLELESCREQITCLKSEFEKQKQSFKMQLTNEEKKLNESWVAARAAERRQEELRQENTQLRQKLSHMQRDPDQSLIIKNSVKRGETNGSLPSPILLENEFDGIHSPPAPIPLDFDGPLPNIPPPPHMMMPMFPPPPMPMFNRPPHIHPGLPGLPPLPPGMPPPFMGHLPPPPHPDRRLPPAGRIASPPGYDRRSYSPGSDYSDHRYSPGPRYSPGGGNRGHSPDRRSDRSRQSNVNSRRKDRPSPDRWFTRSPQGFKRHSPHRYYNNDDNLDDKRTMANSGKKTSTPLGPNDR